MYRARTHTLCEFSRPSTYRSVTGPATRDGRAQRFVATERASRLLSRERLRVERNPAQSSACLGDGRGRHRWWAVGARSGLLPATHVAVPRAARRRSRAWWRVARDMAVAAALFSGAVELI